MNNIKTFVIATDLLIANGLPSVLEESRSNISNNTGRKTLTAKVNLSDQAPISRARK